MSRKPGMSLDEVTETIKLLSDLMGGLRRVTTPILNKFPKSSVSKLNSTIEKAHHKIGDTRQEIENLATNEHGRDAVFQAAQKGRNQSAQRDQIRSTAVVAWHRPLCSWCQQPIEKIEEAYAGWYEDPRLPYDARCYGPQVVHAGESGCRYYHRFPDGHRDSGVDGNGNCGIKDSPIHWFRRAPTAATAIAMRRAQGDREANAWQCWLSIVLGLTMPTWDSLADMSAKHEVGTEAIDIVPLTSDVRIITPSPTVGLKIYAVHENNAESLIARDDLSESHTYEVEVNGERFGVWLQRLDEPALNEPAPWQLSPQLENRGVTDEEFARWYFDDEALPPVFSADQDEPLPAPTTKEVPF